jgi:glycosyltransferase involved in cell wall biosynthesis
LIRIAFVIPTLDQSGAERQLSLLAAGLPRERYEVHVVALVRGGYFQQQLVDSGVTVHVLGKSFRFDPRTGWRLRRLLRQLAPQIVQSFLFSANALVRLPGVVPSGTNVVVSERCVDTWKSRWQLWLDRRLARRAAAMTANSAAVRDFYTALGTPMSQVHVVPNGVPAAPAERDFDWIRERFRLGRHLRLVGYVGRLAEQKRVMDIVWAFQLLHQLVDDVHLVIIGDGPERGRLEQFARNMGCDDKITFAGHCDDAYRLMQGLEVFGLASSFEGMSNSLLDAMALGVPAVVSDIPANLELIQHEVNGLTFPVTKAPELTQGLRRLLQEPETATRLGVAAATVVREHYTVESMVRHHVQLYENLVAGCQARQPDQQKD